MKKHAKKSVWGYTGVPGKGGKTLNYTRAADATENNKDEKGEDK